MTSTGRRWSAGRPAVVILTPAEFDEAIYGSHELITEVRVLGATAAEDTIVYPTGGSVTLDLTAAVRGSCQLQFGDPTLIPQAVGDLLVPYGNEIQVSRGIRSGGFEHLVPLGIFGIQDVSLSDTPEGITIDVTGADRAQKAIDATFEAAFEISPAAGSTRPRFSTLSAGG